MKMRFKLTVICFSILFSSCVEKKPNQDAMKPNVANPKDLVPERDPRTTKIDNYIKDLKETQAIEFGAGDTWGTRYIFNNTDSSVIRVLIKYSSGDYGNGQDEFLLVDNKLIYQKNYSIDWLAEDPLPDTSDYQIRETILFFNPDSTGTKESKFVYSQQLEITEEKTKELKAKLPEKKVLSKNDYINSIEELKNALAMKKNDVE